MVDTTTRAEESRRRDALVVHQRSCEEEIFQRVLSGSTVGRPALPPSALADLETEGVIGLQR